MSIKIAIASGKGGTGKTTVSVNLYHFIKQYWTQSVQLVDCDVEEPNDALFFPDYRAEEPENAEQQIPHIHTDICNFCRRCVDYCEFNAIVVIPPAQFAEVNPALCHSCGACLHACNIAGAIEEKTHPIGQITSFNYQTPPPLIQGKLNIGSPMQTMVIKDLLKHQRITADIQLLDAPPGTSCPVVATINPADYTLLVAEPSPFGLHDMKLMINLLREIQKPFGVIINKADNCFSETELYLRHNNIDILGQIPYSTKYAKHYAQGDLLTYIPDDFKEIYKSIIVKIQNKLQQHA